MPLVVVQLSAQPLGEWRERVDSIDACLIGTGPFLWSDRGFLHFV
jgi:hypothetical protein